MKTKKKPPVLILADKRIFVVPYKDYKGMMLRWVAGDTTWDLSQYEMLPGTVEIMSHIEDDGVAGAQYWLENEGGSK